jgi:hypothetical protein
LGSRRSTLSRQITSEDLDDPMPTVCPSLGVIDLTTECLD